MNVFSSLDNLTVRGVPLLLAVCLNGCSTLDYYAHLAGGQLELLRRREPVAAVVADPARDPALRQRLAQAQAARRFASARLGLPDNASYRLYADLGRPYVVWNLFATEEFSVAPVTHCFPIAGCVAYRGFYELGRARGAAALLNRQGLDTFVGGVEAYSTLGWFADPILAGMLRHGDDALAALIFHELAHQRLYVPNDTAFNESFASFVEREGLRQWRASRGLPPPDERRAHRSEQFSRLVLETREQLRQLYASGLPADELRRRKAAEFERLRQRYRALRDVEWQGDRRYDAWVEGPLNNAKLLPFGLYDGWVPAFAEIFRRAGRDWPRFYEQAERLTRLPAAARERRLAELQAGAPPTLATQEDTP
ncbi:aminopeptidase [Azotobacter salinestris]|uniref:aminopeptidase n=1 Tax=Azotobacter salinestris TaxID=69964 RepID=UPI0032DF5DD1